MLTETTSNDLAELSRREIQIMEILYTSGPSTVAQVTERMPDGLSRNAVRTFLTILVHKRRVTHTKQGREFIYAPASKKETVARTAFQKLLDVFFNGSLSDAVAARFAAGSEEIDDKELTRLQKLIDEARKSRTKS